MQYLLAIFIAFVLVGCQSTKPGPTKAIGSKGVISRGDILASKGPIKLPMNFDSQTSKTDELNMLVEFKNLRLDTTGRSNKIDINQNQLIVARSYLEKTIAYLKRFDVYMKSSTGDVMALSSELADIGDVAYSEPVQRNKFDLYLQASLILGGEKTAMYDGSDELTYTVSVIFVIADEKQSAVGRPIETIGVAKRNLIREAIVDAMKKALPAFGNEFPITATVQGVAGFDINKMSIDRGSNHGITNDNQLVVWYKDAGVSIPLAYARAEAGKNESTLSIYKWDKSPGAQYAQDQLSSDRSWFRQNPIFATSLGLSYPQEWER